LNGFDAFVGVPYLDRGRTMDGCDCWGLVRMVMAQLASVQLPSYDEAYVTAADRRAIDGLIAGELEPWSMITSGQEQTLDAVLMREGRFARHIGLVVAPGRLLHVEEGRTSVIEPYRHGRLAARLLGFYRYTAA
jgi:cell wall-associated NlpC family hydrolase